MWREVFSYSINPEVFLDSDNVRALMRPLDDGRGDREAEAPDSLDAALDAFARQARQAEESWQALYASIAEDTTGTDTPLSEEIDRLLVTQSAPTAMSLGAWLQGLSAPAVFEDPAHLEALAALADDVGVGGPEQARHDAFRAIARRMGLSELTGTARDIAAHPEIRDGAYRLGGLLHAVSRRSDAFGPEIAGINLALRHVGMLPPWRCLRARSGAPEWSRLDLAQAQTAALPADHTQPSIARALAEAFGADPASRRRVRFGVHLAHRLVLEWNALLSDLARAMISPRLAMALLVQERAREAAVYHQAYKLEGRSLADWFREAQEAPLPLVDALGRSKLVRPHEPDKSRLINELIRADGPMFRIFRNEDVRLMRRWIASLAQAPAAAPAEAEADGEPALPFAASPGRKDVGAGDASLGAVPRSLREAYYLLQGRALAPRTRDFALDYCRFWLKRARDSVDRTDRSLPGTWRPGVLREWLLDSHDKHADAFEESRDQPMPSREAVIDQTLQLAPLTLIDGAWLQGFTDIALASTRVGCPLFETYWDELGNGEWAINHPKIYRDVLAAMDIVLPPTGSPEFAADPRLREESFRLPVYWLCLGKFPTTFRPEVLGMNLAMELSGVGGSYRNAREFLKHYGFPTVFVDIHNTIDNVSKGHSAWAADAIDAYMQNVVEFGDVESAWARVRTGYESLAPIVKRDTDLCFFRTRPRPEATFAEDAGVFRHVPVAA